jgi:hypothetical protein
MNNDAKADQTNDRKQQVHHHKSMKNDTKTDQTNDRN